MRSFWIVGWPLVLMTSFPPGDMQRWQVLEPCSHKHSYASVHRKLDVHRAGSSLEHGSDTTRTLDVGPPEPYSLSQIADSLMVLEAPRPEEGDRIWTVRMAMKNHIYGEPATGQLLAQLREDGIELEPCQVNLAASSYFSSS